MSDSESISVHCRWELVEKVKLHKLKPDIDRRGPIVTVTMKLIPNEDLARYESVVVCQLLMLFGSSYGIHSLGQDGEQNHTWVTIRSYRGQQVVCEIVHKYIGDEEIETIRDSVRLLARRWKWELEDDTVNPLEALAKL
jgi:hypothetical protein